MLSQSIAVFAAHQITYTTKMMTKILALFFVLVAVCSAGIVPAALTVGTYASSYNAHAINHAYAAPYVAAPAVAAAAPLAYTSPLVYSSLPSYSPYAAYSSPIFAARR